MGELLKSKRVRDEIVRYQWLESEIIGYDIGHERAAKDWLRLYSRSWLKYSSAVRKNKNCLKRYN